MNKIKIELCYICETGHSPSLQNPRVYEITVNWILSHSHSMESNKKSIYNNIKYRKKYLPVGLISLND